MSQRPQLRRAPVGMMLLIALLPLIAAGNLAHAGLDEGWSAYNRGDYQGALRELRPLAEQGNALAQFKLAYMYANGEGLPKDYAQAVTWYKKAAEQGNAWAQNNLGILYQQGTGVGLDLVEAANWYRKSAQQGNEAAKGNLRRLETQAPQLFGWKHSDDTALKSQAIEGCRDPLKWSDVDDCYVRLLKGFRGRPESLLQYDLRDAVAYCAHAAESNDSRFCGDLNRGHPTLFSDDLRQRMEASGWERKKQEAAEAALPKTELVFAQSVHVVPGAIVCPNYRTVQLMVDWYTQHWGEKFEDKITKGQSELVRGAAIAEPNLARYGCVLLPPGTPMNLERGNSVPVVSARLPDGREIRGVTSYGMFKR